MERVCDSTQTSPYFYAIIVPMSNYLAIFCLSFTVALSGALMPGPLLAAVIAESAGGGWRAGPLMIAGHALLEGSLLVCLVLGLGRYLASPAIIAAVTAAGSLFLIYSGIQMLVSLKRLTIESACARASGPLKLVTAGVVVSATNPYWSVWWMTIGLGLALSAGKAGLAGVGIFFCGHILADLLWYSCVSFVIGCRRAAISTGIYRGLLAVCALTLAGFGLYFLLSIRAFAGK